MLQVHRVVVEAALVHTKNWSKHGEPCKASCSLVPGAEGTKLGFLHPPCSYEAYVRRSELGLMKHMNFSAILWTDNITHKFLTCLYGLLSELKLECTVDNGVSTDWLPWFQRSIWKASYYDTQCCVMYCLLCMQMYILYHARANTSCHLGQGLSPFKLCHNDFTILRVWVHGQPTVDVIMLTQQKWNVGMWPDPLLEFSMGLGTKAIVPVP